MREEGASKRGGRGKGNVLSERQVIESMKKQACPSLKVFLVVYESVALEKRKTEEAEA